ncbi:MAG: hypothetical protein QM831_30350 [Kofleriaceae bacterium]
MARLIACALLVTTGCSFVLTSAPTPPPADPDCTRSNLVPAVDVGIAIMAVFVAGLSAGGGALGSEEKGPEYGGLAVMGLAATSAIYGFVRTSQCRAAYNGFYMQPRYYPNAPPAPGYSPYPNQPPPAPFPAPP